MIVRRVLIGAIAAAVTASAIAVVVSASAAPAAASNKAAAVGDAKMLLSKLVLPTGATSVATKPPWDTLRRGSCPCPVTPNAVDDHAWWRVPGTVSHVIAFVKAHPPAGTSVVATSAGSGQGYQSRGVTFAWPQQPGVISTRWLVVSARSLPGGSSGVRADGVSVWVTPRSSSDRVPPAKRLRILVVRGPKVLQGPIAVRSQAKIDKVIAFLNRLPAPQPGVSACPLDRGVRVILDFYASERARRPSAVAKIVVGGCGGVLLTVHGHREQGFGNPPPPASTWSAVASIVGRKLNTG